MWEKVLNKHAPIQHKKIKSGKVPWITNKIKGLINTRDKLKRGLLWGGINRLKSPKIALNRGLKLSNFS